MDDVLDPAVEGQDPPISSPDFPDIDPKHRPKADTLKLSRDEVRAIRIAVRKLVRVHGSFNRLAVMMNIPANTLRRVSNPKGSRPSGTFAIRLAAVAGIPVEVLLGGKMVVAPVIIGRAA